MITPVRSLGRRKSKIYLMLNFASNPRDIKVTNKRKTSFRRKSWTISISFLNILTQLIIRTSMLMGQVLTFATSLSFIILSFSCLLRWRIISWSQLTMNMSWGGRDYLHQRAMLQFHPILRLCLSSQLCVVNYHHHISQTCMSRVVILTPGKLTMNECCWLTESF